jgi:hypothetical protein
MSKVENSGDAARLLLDKELDAVAGGVWSPPDYSLPGCILYPPIFWPQPTPRFPN